jgi:aminoglycoside phosphotransferase (APT) family kinase protein
VSDEQRIQLAQLFPQLGHIDQLNPIDEGWMCETFEVNDEWIVQLPRNERAAERLLVQMDVLPELAREVSAAIPIPELVSRDPPAMGYRRIPGGPAGDDQGIWPERLGRFLYELHLTPPEFVGLRARSAEEVRRGVRAEWDRLREAGGTLLGAAELRRADDLFGGTVDDDRNWRISPCLAHNDLGPEHVLVSADGDLAGVIDWETVAVTDPVADFAWWLHERPDAGERALAAYGGAPDDRFRDRARFAYALMPWHEVEYGLSGGGDTFVQSGLAGVRSRLALIAS